MELLQECPAEGEKWETCLQEETVHTSGNLSDHLAGDTLAETVMTQ